MQRTLESRSNSRCRRHRCRCRFLGAAACEAAAAFGSLPVLLATWIFAPPQAGEKDERRFEKRNLCSRVPRLLFHVTVFWSHAKSRVVLGGTLGENAAWCSGHGSSAQEDGCGLSPAAGPARHVVLCGHRSVFSSPPGRQSASPPRIFSTNPLFATRICFLFYNQLAFARLGQLKFKCRPFRDYWN